MVHPAATRHHVWPRLVTVLGIVALCTGASSQSCSSAPNESDESSETPRFVVTLQLQNAAGDATDTFERDELIQMVLRVRNRTDRAQTLDFPTTRQADFLVVRADTDDVAWQLSDEAAPPSNLASSLEFAPGQIRTITTVWDQIDASGDRVRAGAYEARGVVIFSGFDANPLRLSELGSTIEKFTIN